MIAEDDFLRKLPACIDAEQRMRLEALVFCADSAAVAYVAMQKVAEKIHLHTGAPRPSDRSELITHAWTIVNQIHFSRLLIKSLTKGKLGPNQKAFYERHAVSHKLRNASAHIDQNLPNRAKEKNTPSPLFGVVTFFHVGSEDIDRTADHPVLKGGNIVAVMSGMISPGDKNLFGMSNPGASKIHLPVSQFNLTAFGHLFDIDRAIFDLRDLVLAMSKAIEAELRAQAESLSKDTGMSIADILRPATAEFVMTLELAFIAPESASEG